VSVVGSRAATAYGAHVATEIAAGLSGQGWTVIFGAAYGIDAAAHHGAVVAGGATVAALACAADHTYPRGHEDLLANVAAQGAVIRRIPARPNPATTEVSRP
jgi:DNA processing protein